MHSNTKKPLDHPVTMNDVELIEYLRVNGILKGTGARLIPLAGGVSSDISVVESDSERFVVKRALERLKVEDEWHCDTARNITEFEAIRYAGQIFPDSVPRLLHTDSANRLFVMEFFGPEYTPWKELLLRGVIDLKIAERTAILLAGLHQESWLDASARQTFDTGDDFFALRVEPYLLATGRRHSDLEWMFQREASRIQQTNLALVHGDWSAKNLLVSKDRVVVLDWEAAWFGDPAFDAAFFLNLIYLKSLHNRAQLSEYLQLVQTFRSVYGSQVYSLDAELELRIIRLTLMLLLGRIDGKSRAEYITSPADKELVRSFARKSLIAGIDNWSEVDRRWRKAIANA